MRRWREIVLVRRVGFAQPTGKVSERSAQTAISFLVKYAYLGDLCEKHHFYWLRSRIDFSGIRNSTKRREEENFNNQRRQLRSLCILKYNSISPHYLLPTAP